MATQLGITALEISFDPVAGRREELVDRFSCRLLPMPRPPTRCSHTPTCLRRNALLDALVALRRSLRDLSSVVPFLGARHARYGVCAEHYPLVGAALLQTMAVIH